MFGCAVQTCPLLDTFAHDNPAIIPTRCLVQVGVEKPKEGPPGGDCALGEPFHVVLQGPPSELQKPRYTSSCKIGTVVPLGSHFTPVRIPASSVSIQLS